MGGKDALVSSRGSADASKPHEQTTDKKNGFVDWVNLIKPGNEETDHWVPDEAVSKCTSCATDLGAVVHKHHCRNCVGIFCDKCMQRRMALIVDEQAQQVRVFDRCMVEVTQRLSNAKEVTSKSTAIHSHEDLARKLQEEMEKNLKLSPGSKSDGFGKRTREVECPICTVHLQRRRTRRRKTRLRSDRISRGVLVSRCIHLWVKSSGWRSALPLCLAGRTHQPCNGGLSYY